MSRGAWGGLNGRSLLASGSQDEQLLAKILPDNVAGSSGSDKARALIAAHGDLERILQAESHQLRMVVPLSQDEIDLLESMRRVAGLVPKEVLRPVINSISSLEVYLRTSSKRESSGDPRALLLDRRNRLQGDAVLENYLRQDVITASRELIRIVRKHGGSAAIITESRRRAGTSFEPALIAHAKGVGGTLRAVGIVLHDYVRWSDRACESMRGLGLL
jgi:DNA repair protein RadC